MLIQRVPVIRGVTEPEFHCGAAVDTPSDKVFPRIRTNIGKQSLMVEKSCLAVSVIQPVAPCLFRAELFIIHLVGHVHPHALGKKTYSIVVG